MSSSARRGLPALLLLVMLNGMAFGAGTGTTGDTTKTPDLAWVDLSGHPRQLDQFRGRIVVLNFWATWCIPCRGEIPDLVRIQNRYGMYGVQVVGASADTPETASTVIRFARRHKIDFPVLLGATTPQMRSLGLAEALPGTVVIDRDGGIVERISGVFEREELEALLDRLVEGAPGVDVHDHGSAAEGDTDDQAAHEQEDPHDHSAEGHGHEHEHGGEAGASLVPS